MKLYAVWDEGSDYEAPPSIVGIYTSVEAAKAAGFPSLSACIGEETMTDRRGRKHRREVWQDTLTGNLSRHRVGHPPSGWTIDEIVPDTYKP